MNYFDATKGNADPRSTSASDEVYRIIGAVVTGKFPTGCGPPRRR